MQQIAASFAVIPDHRPAHILPQKMYVGIAAETVRWTERHLAQVIKIKPDGFRYVTRMRECRPTRTCNLHACPQCWRRQEARRVVAFRNALSDHPMTAIVTLDILLPPRDRLVDQDNAPIKDARHIRKVLKAAFADVVKRGGRVVVSGRYEFEPKRAGSTAFIRQHAAKTAKSRVVVPHLHAVAFAVLDGCYLTPREIRRLLEPHFPGNRQVKIGRLHEDKAASAAFSAAVCYAFKGHTASLTGRLLRDYVSTQINVRKDAWVITI